MIKDRVTPVAHVIASPWYVILGKLASGEKTLSYQSGGEFELSEPTEEIAKLHRHEGLFGILPSASYLALSYSVHLLTLDYPGVKQELTAISLSLVIMYVISAFAVGDVRINQPEEN